MNVFTKYSGREINNLQGVYFNKYCLFVLREGDNDLTHLLFRKGLKYDIFFKLHRLRSYVYYEYLNYIYQNGDEDFYATLFFCWPDLRRNLHSELTEEEEEPYRRYKSPVFTGLCIPSGKSEVFLSEYQKAVCELGEDSDREPAPHSFLVTPMLTFNNFDRDWMGEETFGFVAYYGYTWHELDQLTRCNDGDPTQQNTGYLELPTDFFGNAHLINVSNSLIRRLNEDRHDPPPPLEGEEEAPMNDIETFTQNISINDIETFTEEKCVLCLDAKPNIMFCSCGHICTCESCFKSYNKYYCPVCRKISNNIRKNEIALEKKFQDKMCGTDDRDEESISFLISYLQAESKIDTNIKDHLVRTLTKYKNYVGDEDLILSYLEDIIKDIRDGKINGFSELDSLTDEISFLNLIKK